MRACKTAPAGAEDSIKSHQDGHRFDAYRHANGLRGRASGLRRREGLPEKGGVADETVDDGGEVPLDEEHNVERDGHSAVAVQDHLVVFGDVDESGESEPDWSVFSELDSGCKKSVATLANSHVFLHALCITFAIFCLFVVIVVVCFALG